MSVAITGFENVAKLLIENGADQTIVNEDGHNALHYAAAYGRPILIPMLNKVDCNSVDKEGNSPLHLVANTGFSNQIIEPTAKPSIDQYILAFEELLKIEGIKLDIKNNHGQTPLNFAIISGISKMIEDLFNAKADFNVVDEKGNNILHEIASNGRKEIFYLLSETLKFTDFAKMVDVPNKDGDTPLHLAVKCSGQDRNFLVGLFIEMGANVNILNLKGETPLILASKQVNLEFVNLLIDSKANLNVKDSYELTALNHADLMESKPIVNALIKAEAELTPFPDGREPLYYKLNKKNDSTKKEKESKPKKEKESKPKKEKETKKRKGIKTRKRKGN